MIMTVSSQLQIITILKSLRLERSGTFAEHFQRKNPTLVRRVLGFTIVLPNLQLLLKEIINMPELKIKCQHPESLKILLKTAVEKELQSLSNGIERTKQRLQEFETKYQLSTEEFLTRYENDEFTETLELDEWIGESWMLKNLREEVENLKVVEFVN